MPVEHLQCPVCDAPVHGESSIKPTACPYCGSSLQAGAIHSPSPSTFPDEIQRDTELLSRQAALAHLQQQLQALGSQRDKAQRALEAQVATIRASHQTGCWGVGLLTIGGLAVLAGLGGGEVLASLGSVCHGSPGLLGHALQFGQ